MPLRQSRIIWLILAIVLHPVAAVGAAKFAGGVIETTDIFGGLSEELSFAGAISILAVRPVSLTV